MTGPGPYPPPANQACSGGSGGFPPGSKRRPVPLSPSLSALRLSLSLSLFLIPSFCCPFPGSCSRGPSLPGRRTLLTRQADPPYPAGGYSSPLTRKADTPYSEGRRHGKKRIIYSGRESPTAGRILLARRGLLAHRLAPPPPRRGGAMHSDSAIALRDSDCVS